MTTQEIRPARPVVVAADHVPPVRIGIWMIITSLLGFGPMPWTRVVTCLALVDEANRSKSAGRRPTPNRELSIMETKVRVAGEGRADRWVDRAYERRMEPLVKGIGNDRAERNYLERVKASTTDANVVGVRGESIPPDEAREQYSTELEEITDAESAGDLRHRRVEASTKKKLYIFLGLDFVLLLYLLTRLFNINPATAVATISGGIRLAAAVVFAVLGTVLVAFGMKTLGRRHRDYRNSFGGLAVPAGARLMIGLELGAAVLVAASICCAMAWRLVLDGRDSDSSFLTAVLAILFGAVTLVAAYLAWVSEFSDGSRRTDVVDAFAGQFHARDAAVHALTDKQALLDESIARRREDLHRADTAIRVTATAMVAHSSRAQAILFARAWHQHADGQLPDPQLDFDRLDQALDQASSGAQLRNLRSGA